MKKYNITIEQPMVKSVTIEADTIEEAIDIATKQYNREEIVITNDDIGTEAQIQAVEVDDKGEEIDGGEATEWCEL